MLGEADFVLIEGAGGWRVPLNRRETLADVAVQLQVGVILVVGMQLGCINHALLTAEAIRRDGLQLAGWVANQPGPRMTCHEETLDTLREMLPAPLLGDVPFLPQWQAAEMQQYVDIQPLLH
jgi:dethiobiotin synthetase